MLSIKNNIKNKLHADIQQWQNKESEKYQAMLAVHKNNAITYSASTKIIYEAIQLARFNDAQSWAWRLDQAETHPALLLLSAYWQSLCEEDEGVHEARIPYIQLFLGKETYVPLMPDAASMPILIENKILHETVHNSSVIMGEHFLITFLAGRKISANKSVFSSLIHYTVNDKPLLKENLLFSKQTMTLSSQILKGLFEFPKRFPSLWLYLTKQQEVTHYEIH